MNALLFQFRYLKHQRRNKLFPFKLIILRILRTMAAIQICIPNNCSWEETTGTFQRDREQPRTKLQLVDEALRKLRAIHGPVCVVSIAGPCRRGKSYILSQVFDQGDVFPLGHSFDPETMGIWMWVIPEKYRDDFGYEFTVVLLDSEGIDAVSAEGVSDHAIFTLTVLLSSVLIYNSVGVPTRTDLEVLEHPCKNTVNKIIYMSSANNEAVSFSFPMSLVCKHTLNTDVKEE